ncbi:DUF6254 family protein [Ornithinibacillus halophilus]|uniref:Uncharacterized protein n=1 Tax=Ornithinibacillus halophilus TaxID=930117 RepID=A0A1M5LJC4_9BACI|nr:DUF6254 family protein [Ornithinibacillus halophilus]SHG65244.1 hypothetical protein SAMN05216225_10482 [Ornithinibacillus halophilus]
MTRSKAQKERQWRAQKNAKNPHGKVKSLDQLADEVTKNEKN